ncbi:MAG: dihydrodipicolinate synthase family protein [Bacteroidales bacterium]|nr:dihydrodipicolinate synthase family protein [Bacteroidales bacterium]
MKKKFQGVVVPMITPLKQNLTIDTAAVTRIMGKFAENGISPLVLGTTGESASVGEKESLRFMQAAVKARKPGQLVYAGLVGNDVGALLSLARQYADMGVDAVVSTLPSYYILTPDQMKKFYLTLAETVKAPVFMYNIKATTQMSIPLEVVEELSHHPNIAGLKDSERDEEKMKKSIELFEDRADFSFFCGWGAQGGNSLKLGADGIVPSTGNIVPELYGWLYRAFTSGDFAAVDHFQALTDQVGAVYQKGRTLGQSLAALKVLMHDAGLCGTTMMPPLTEYGPEEANLIIANFKALAL